MVLEKRRILGEEHPKTLSAMNSLASTQGKTEEAETMFTAVLEKIKVILGDECPGTLSVMNNLASTLRDQNRLEEAATVQTEVLQKRRRALGESTLIPSRR